jgi:hypothetical protein
MRAEGLEPPRSLDHEDLNLARLPRFRHARREGPVYAEDRVVLLSTGEPRHMTPPNGRASAGLRIGFESPHETEDFAVLAAMTP